MGNLVNLIMQITVFLLVSLILITPPFLVERYTFNRSVTIFNQPKIEVPRWLFLGGIVLKCIIFVIVNIFINNLPTRIGFAELTHEQLMQLTVLNSDMFSFTGYSILLIVLILLPLQYLILRRYDRSRVAFKSLVITNFVSYVCFFLSLELLIEGLMLGCYHQGGC